MNINVNFNENNYKIIEEVEVGQCFILLGRKDLFIMTDNDFFVSIKTGATFYVEDYENYPVEIKDDLAVTNNKKIEF